MIVFETIHSELLALEHNNIAIYTRITGVINFYHAYNYIYQQLLTLYTRQDTYQHQLV